MTKHGISWTSSEIWACLKMGHTSVMVISIGAITMNCEHRGSSFSDRPILGWGKSAPNTLKTGFPLAKLDFWRTLLEL